VVVINYPEAQAHYRALIGRPFTTEKAVESFCGPILDERNQPGLEAILWAAWETVVAAAGEADDRRLAQLVELVAAVQAYPAPDALRVWDRRVFADLPVLGAQLREQWNLVPPADRTAASWTSLNGFAARLTPDVLDLLLFGLWTLSTALETFADVASNVPAAVQWLEHAGPQLVSATLHGRTYVGRPGELAVRAGLTETGFSVPRWTFWRSRLAALAEDGDAQARAGLRIMRRYDKQIVSYRT
jgi:Protein of unknown function (DUF3632)